MYTGYIKQTYAMEVNEILESNTNPGESYANPGKWEPEQWLFLNKKEEYIWKESPFATVSGARP